MSPLEQHLHRRTQERAALARVQTEAALSALRGRHVKAILIGSLACGRFLLHSDVELLIEDRAGLSDAEVYDVVSDHITSARFDLAFADRVRPELLAMLRHGVDT
jgi:predicted nucleotidyltransferase